MIFTVIAEGRSGGQELTEWFKQSIGNTHIIVHEPFRSGNDKFTNSVTPDDFSWVNPSKNYFIKELWSTSWDYSDFLNVSDIVLCLYRDNWYDQTRSLLYSLRSGIWRRKYREMDVNKLVSEEDIIDFYNSSQKQAKILFKEWINKNNLPSISYEELYYQGGIEKIKKIFKIDSNIPFPIGGRYLTKDEFLI